MYTTLGPYGWPTVGSYRVFTKSLQTPLCGRGSHGLIATALTYRPTSPRESVVCFNFINLACSPFGVCDQDRGRRSTGTFQFENNYFTEMCSGSEAGSYLTPIDFVYHSTLGLRVIKKRRRGRSGPAVASLAAVGQRQEAKGESGAAPALRRRALGSFRLAFGERREARCETAVVSKLYKRD